MYLIKENLFRSKKLIILKLLILLSNCSESTIELTKVEWKVYS